VQRGGAGGGKEWEGGADRRRREREDDAPAEVDEWLSDLRLGEGNGERRRDKTKGRMPPNTEG
jgi:hypothetical protein